MRFILTWICLSFITTLSAIESLIPLPLTRQSSDYTCGAAITISLLGYYGEVLLEADVVPALGTNPVFGTDRKEMRRFFEERGFSVDAHSHMTMNELQSYLQKGIPVICLIQAWDEQSDYSNYWEIGHYVVAIGFDEENLYFLDPWILGHYGFIPKREFMGRWHQFTHEKEYLHQWGMAVFKGVPAFKGGLIEYIP